MKNNFIHQIAYRLNKTQDLMNKKGFLLNKKAFRLNKVSSFIQQTAHLIQVLRSALKQTRRFLIQKRGTQKQRRGGQVSSLIMSLLPEIAFELHDSNLISFQIGPRQELSLRIALYNIFYPGNRIVQMRFGAITNMIAITDYFAKLDEPEPEEYIARIDTFHYDTILVSTAGKLRFYLELDWEGSLCIHCGKFSMKEIKADAPLE